MSKKKIPTPRSVSCWPKYDLVITSFPTNPNQGQSCMIVSSDDFDDLAGRADEIALSLPVTAYVTVSQGDSFWNPDYQVTGMLEPMRRVIYLSGPPHIEGECNHHSAVIDGDGFRCKSCSELLGPEYEVSNV